MKTQKFLKHSNLPPKPSILGLIVWWLVLERFNAPGWLYGCLYTLLGFIFIAEVWRMFSGESVDLLGNDKKTS